MKQHFLLGIAVFAGLLAAFFANQYFSAEKKALKNEWDKLKRQYATREVVVFKKEKTQDSVITQDDIVKREIPIASIRPDSIFLEDSQRIVGRRLVNHVSAGTPVYWTDIEGGDTTRQAGLASIVDRNMRAISINVSGTASVSGQVRPNDKVDVIGTFVLDSADRPNEKEQVTLTVLQNVMVLATGRETSRTLARVTADRAASYSMVTLLVSPREAETLVACEQNRGKLTLALRNPADLGYETEIPTVDFKYIRTILSELNELRQKNNRSRPGVPPIMQ